MFRRFVCLLMLSMMLSTLLVACGDAVIPTYSGATSVTVPAAISSSFQTSAGSGVKNATVTGFASTDAPDKVKSFFVDNFKKNGWDDKSSDSSIVDGNKQISASVPGANISLFQKDDKAAGVFVIPGNFASTLGISGVADSGTLYMIFSGQKA